MVNSPQRGGAGGGRTLRPIHTMPPSGLYSTVHPHTFSPRYFNTEQKLNSCTTTYNFIEVSRHNLKIYISSNSPNLFCITAIKLLYTVKVKCGKLVRKPNPLPYGLGNPSINLKYENSQDYALQPHRNCQKLYVYEFGFRSHKIRNTELYNQSNFNGLKSYQIQLKVWCHSWHAFYLFWIFITIHTVH